MKLDEIAFAEKMFELFDERFEQLEEDSGAGWAFDETIGQCFECLWCYAAERWGSAKARIFLSHEIYRLCGGRDEYPPK